MNETFAPKQLLLAAPIPACSAANRLAHTTAAAEAA